MQSDPPSPADPSPPAEADPRIGVLLGGRWKVLRRIGQGGMGVVYEAENIAIRKRVALKFIDSQAATDRDTLSRFQREAEASSAVDSAHIVQVFDTGQTDDGVPYLVMEFLRGETLGQRIRRLRQKPLPVAGSRPHLRTPAPSLPPRSRRPTRALPQFLR